MQADFHGSCLRFQGSRVPQPAHPAEAREQTVADGAHPLILDPTQVLEGEADEGQVETNPLVMSLRYTGCRELDRR